MEKRTGFSIAIGLLLLATLAAALYGLAPLSLPPAQPAEAPAEQFSAGRAFQHVPVIGQQPHPAGSAAMGEVAAYLMQTLQADGYQPEIQPATVQKYNKTFDLKNVVARLPGSAPSGALLILAHPDSTPFGPGAGDNGTGAAVLLEVARALKAGAPPKNDIIFLFDDGEEYRDLGGYAFAGQHPWMPEVRMVIGMDTAAWGPPVMLQAINNNGKLIQGIAQAVKRPMAFGLYYDADWTIGHDDSLIMPFVSQGLPGLDFEDPMAQAIKHSPLDTPDKVDPAVMQQMGDQVLALARHFGDADLTQIAAPDESFFSLWGLGLVHYPAGMNLLLAAAAALGYALLVWAGLHQKVLQGKGLALSAVYALGMVLLSIVLGKLLAGLFGVIFPKPQPYIDFYLAPASLPFFIAALALILAVNAAGYLWVGRRIGQPTLGVGGLALWVILALAGGVILKAGSYVWIWPLLLALVGWALVLLGGKGQPAWLRWVWLGLPMLVAVVLIAPILALMYLSTGMDLGMGALLLVPLFNLWILIPAGQAHGLAA